MRPISLVALLLAFCLAIGAGVALAQEDTSCIEPQSEAVPADAVSADVPTSLPDGSTLKYIPLTPCRLVDTRNPSPLGGPFTAGSTRSFYAWGVNMQSAQGGYNGQCGVAAGAHALALTITSTQATGPGHFRAWAYSDTMPLASVLNFSAGTNLANTTIVPMFSNSASYDFSIYTNTPTHLVVDVLGYFIKKEPQVATMQQTFTNLAAGSTTRGCLSANYAPALPGKAVLEMNGTCQAGATGGLLRMAIMYSNNNGGTWAYLDSNYSMNTAAANSWVSGGRNNSQAWVGGTTYRYAVQFEPSVLATECACVLTVTALD